VAALIEMYVQGVSTRKVSKVVAQLCGHTISASAVSAVTKRLDTEVEAWRRRSLAGRTYPYLIIDAHYERVRREGRVMSTVKGHPNLRTWGTPTFAHQREWFTRGDLLLSWPGAEPA
jgi:cyanophycinase-like exopeptidase